jgi:hypothetical protein
MPAGAVLVPAAVVPITLAWVELADDERLLSTAVGDAAAVGGTVETVTAALAGLGRRDGGERDDGRKSDACKNFHGISFV